MAFLAHRFGDKLLNPQAQNTATLGAQEAELVTPGAQVVVQKRSKQNRRVIKRIRGADALGLGAALHQGMQGDAHQSSGNQTENRQSGVTAAHRGLARENLRPAAGISLFLQVGAGIGDGDEMIADLVFGQAFRQKIEDGLGNERRLDGAARFGGLHEQGVLNVDAGHDRANTDGRNGIERAELDEVRINRVVLGHGHRRLG